MRFQIPELEQLADQIAEFIHYWGFKRIHGKIWTYLLLAKKPLDASDLVEKLGISKALVSISLKELLEYNVVEELGKSELGTNLYRPNPDLIGVITAVLRKREKRLLTQISAAHASLQNVADKEYDSIGISRKSVTQLGELIGSSIIGLDALINLKAIDFGELCSDFRLGDSNDENFSKVAHPKIRSNNNIEEEPNVIEDFLKNGIPTLASGKAEVGKNDSESRED